MREDNCHDGLKIFALGGLHQVGANCYIFEGKEDIIIIDCGIKFSSDNLTDGSIPNFSYLSENRSKIRALFVTHAHEDHIGAISFLLKIIPNIPIYGSDFSISLLKQKLIGMKNRPKLNIFRDNTIISSGEFSLSFFRVTHSIPGSFGMFIESYKSDFRSVVTGDFKFDWTGIGEKTDLVKLIEFGKKGVDLLLSDSTNAEVEGNTPSESKVVKVLDSIISEAAGRVIITSFASNVYRLKKVIEIAKKNGRKIVLLGSSLLRMLKAIQKASLWKIESSIFLKPSEISSFQKNKIVVFCTGSQGEERAVLSRLANQNYPDWKVEADDSIILTSSPIMDNNVNVQEINNKLFSLNAKIYENNSDNLLHASGHASQEDLKLMLRMVNPYYFMPFHGDFRMLKSHANLAIELGMNENNIFVCKNGQILEFKDKIIRLLPLEDSVNSSPVYVSNKELISEIKLKESIFEREKMSKGGIIIVIFFWNFKKNQMNDYPYIFTYGFINMKENLSMINNWRNNISRFIVSEISNTRSIFLGNEFWKKKILIYIENIINISEKFPLVKIIFE